MYWALRILARCVLEDLEVIRHERLEERALAWSASILTYVYMYTAFCGGTAVGRARHRT